MVTLKMQAGQALPDIGDIVYVQRPDNTAYLPALYIDHDYVTGREHLMTVHQADFQFAWFTWEGGPTLRTLISEYEYDPTKKKLHQLEQLATYDCLGIVEYLNERYAAFAITHSAPLEIINLFADLYPTGMVNVHQLTIIAASDWHHFGFAQVTLNCGGHNMQFNFAKAQIDFLKDALDTAKFLYEKLPSGSGFNNNWRISFMKDYIQAVTAYDHMDEWGGYDAVIDLDYTLSRKDGKWDVDVEVEFFEDDTDTDYYGDTVHEALNG